MPVLLLIFIITLDTLNSAVAVIDAIVQGIVGQIQFGLGFLAHSRFGEVLQVPFSHVHMGDYRFQASLLIHSIYLLFLVHFILFILDRDYSKEGFA